MKWTALFLLVLTMPLAGRASADSADWWGSAETLLWWFNDGPAPAPLATTAPLGSTAPIPAALSEPDTTVVLGGSQLDAPMQVGGRFTVGRWLATDSRLGLEANYLFLGKTTDSHSVVSDGAVTLANPFFEMTPGQQMPVANYLAVAGIVNDGSATLTSSRRLHGAELNAVLPLVEGNGRSWRLLAGYRFLNVDEDLTFVTAQDDDVSFFPGQFVDTIDQFETRNYFHGGQLGIRGRWMRGMWFWGSTLKVALGNTHEVVRIRGASTTNTGPNFLSQIPVTTVQGGIYAQPTNIGDFARDRFAVLPEVELRLGLQLTPRVRTFVGYDFLYLSNVARPGNQIDGAINSTQLVSFTGVPGGPLVGEARPARLLEGSDFWAQGINLGAEFLW